MDEYFDKDFFKFLFGFVAIVSISLGIVLVSQVYSSMEDSPEAVETTTECENSIC